VERTTAFGLGLLWELRGDSSVEIGVEHAIIDNKNHVRGDDDESTVFRASLTWDL
jgi:hypothetical protein